MRNRKGRLSRLNQKELIILVGENGIHTGNYVRLKQCFSSSYSDRVYYMKATDIAVGLNKTRRGAYYALNSMQDMGLISITCNCNRDGIGVRFLVTKAPKRIKVKTGLDLGK